MSLIQQITDKYGGTYSEEAKKSSSYQSGTISFHPQKGLLMVDGSKLSINIAATGGASSVAELYRITLFLDKDYGQRLELHPKSGSSRFFLSIFGKKETTTSGKALAKYRFKGTERLINALKNDADFNGLILDEEAYIMLTKRHPDKVILRPAYGIRDVDHLERLMAILKEIENHITRH